VAVEKTMRRTVGMGAAEFSRDADFAIHSDPANLERFKTGLGELQAEVIAVPPLSLEHLQRGHVVHFRCRDPEAAGMRVDVLSRMRGVEEFEQLWTRRTTLQGEDVTVYELLSLADLVQAKKTQRDKDWPMIRRLIEADYAACPGTPSTGQVQFWLGQGRTPELLIELARSFPAQAETIATNSRPLVRAAIRGNQAELEDALALEERAERELDRAYWAPLKRELEAMRHPSKAQPG
jgi:hypothetical protein